MVVPMDHIRDGSDLCGVVDHRYRPGAQFLSDGTEHEAERDWLMAARHEHTGDIAYRKTLGVSDMLPPALQNTGRPSTGGVILTASGLTFVGGTDDFRFRAFATATGDKLWEIKLPSSIETAPITYMGSDGRQFVTVVATGGSLTGSEVTNDEIITFALPNK